jgi:hypothetical protein
VLPRPDDGFDAGTGVAVAGPDDGFDAGTEVAVAGEVAAAPFSFFEEHAGVLPGPGDGFDAGTGVAVAGAAAAAPFSCSSWRKTAML